MAARPSGLLRPLRRISYKIYLFAAVVVLMVVLVVHSNTIIARLNTETRNRCDILARFFAVTSFQAAVDPMTRPIFREVVQSIDFPIVLTDRRGIPRAWRGIGIAPESVPDSVLDRAALYGSLTPEVVRIQQIVEKLDRVNQPVNIVGVGEAGVLGFVHYGEPKLTRELRWVPYIELAVILMLLLFGYAGLKSLFAGEQRSLWAAIAKETAHQLGTPLSSLMGWTALLRDASERGELDRDRIEGIVAEMDRDLGRLHKVSSRFGQMGSTPVLKETDLTPVVASVVDYFRSRLPQVSQEISIVERYEPIPRVAIHRELFEWVVENLLRNAIDAIDKPASVIEVSLVWKREERVVELSVRDNGRGMSAEERRKAFQPGYTTKRRGWGLGLPLARRVVAEYHGGRIAIVESVPGIGTSVAVALPVPAPRAPAPLTPREP
jgi:two-component system, NtrC family, sensor histidine kinase KinB